MNACLLSLALLVTGLPAAPAPQDFGPALTGEETGHVPVAVEHGADSDLLARLAGTMEIWHDAGNFVVGAARPGQIRGLRRRGIAATPLTSLALEDELMLVDLAQVDSWAEIDGEGRVLYRSGEVVLVAFPGETELSPRQAMAGRASHLAYTAVRRRPVTPALPAAWRGVPLGTAGVLDGPSDPRVQTLVDQIDALAIEANVSSLASNHSRNSTVPTYIDAARDQIIAQLQGYGYAPTTQFFSSSHGDNVLVEIPGVLTPNKWVVIGAHYDSYAGGGSSPAPGADDNASGSAAVLEIARVLAGAGPFESSVRLIWFAGEEYGLYGSAAAAQASKAAGEEILGMLNTDMNAYRAAGDTRDVDFVTNNTSPALNSFCDSVGATYVAGWASQYGSLGGGSSDHASYNAEGFPAVFYFEDTGQYSPYIHSASDSYPAGTPDFQLADMVTRGVIAAAVTLAEPLDMQIVHTPLPSTQDATGPYQVVADVTSLTGANVTAVKLHYSGDGGQNFTSSLMLASGSTYTGWIPSFGSPLTIEYYIESLDDQGGYEVDPPGVESGGEPHGFFVGTRTPVYATDFEGGAAGWTHAMVSGEDDWQQDTPAGQSADPSSAWSGTKVWGNDLGQPGWNGAYSSYTENYLRSPSVDCSSAGNVTLELRRWLTVESGQYDQAQIRVNGAIIWQNPQSVDLIDTSWVDFSQDISALAAGNPSVQVEFRLITDSSLTFGGWTLDDFALVEVGPGSTTCAPTIYCAAKVNSQGCTPALSTSGTPSASDPNPFRIDAGQVLNRKNGILFYGWTPGVMPFQGGSKCVMAPMRRTMIQNSGGNPPPDDCSGTYTYDFNARIRSGADPLLAAGQMVYAQYWSRDPASPSTTGLTDAVAFLICP